MTVYFKVLLYAQAYDKSHILLRTGGGPVGETNAAYSGTVVDMANFCSMIIKFHFNNCQRRQFAVILFTLLLIHKNHHK